MPQRGVTEADIESVLDTQLGPHRPGRQRGHIVRQGFDTSGRLLDVVFTEYGEVVTVFRP